MQELYLNNLEPYEPHEHKLNIIIPRIFQIEDKFIFNVNGIMHAKKNMKDFRMLALV